MNKYKKNIFVIIIMLFLFGGFILYKNVNKSYGYFSNISTAREILSNVSAFYYDRGEYIQYDDSYINNNIKRSNGYYYPDDANRDNIIYMDNVSFIGNVFNSSFDYDIRNIFGSLNIDSIYKYGEDIYNKAVLDSDSRVNYTDNDNVLDYYDNTVTMTTASIGNVDYHILTMYVNNDEDINKEYIYNKLVNTLYIGDIIVYDNNVLLYVGNNRYIYCSGESYDYENNIDYREDKSIRYGNISNLNDIDHDKYLFNSDRFYVFRIFNRYGTWRLTQYYNSMKEYYKNDIVPKIKIEKYSDINRSNYVYNDMEINNTIRIYNNTNDKIIIPSIREDLDSSSVYVSNDYGDDVYSNGVLLFNNVELDGNSYKDINYAAKIINEDGYYKAGTTSINTYQLNSYRYKIGKKININKIINSYDKYDNVKDLYKNLYDIDIDIDNIWDNVIDSDNNYIDGYELLVDGLYGGRKINTSDEYISNRCRYIDKDMLNTGDIIFYDDKYVIYIDDGKDKYLYDYSDKKINNNIDLFLDSLLGMDKFMVIRPSYLYSKNDIDFGTLDVDYDNNIIKLDSSDIYDNIIKEISGYNNISIKDRDNNEIDINSSVRSSDMIIIDDDIYYISLLGDINGDGNIDTADVLKLHRFVIKRASIGERYYIESSYINNDKDIDTADVLKLHRFVIKKIDKLGG